jgi:hypothetical protein
MISDPEKKLRRCGPSPLTVRVDHTGRGAWEVTMPDQRERLTCETLDDARRVAYLCAARTRPCELIVRDAYHRVLHHEVINGKGDPTATRPHGRPSTSLR